jgi:hypothetical protein
MGPSGASILPHAQLPLLSFNTHAVASCCAALALMYLAAQLRPERPVTVIQQLLQQHSLTFYHLLQSLGAVPSAGPRW